MLTSDSDRDIQAHCCANCVVNLATVSKHPLSCHCSVPNSCVAAVTDNNIVPIQVITEFRGVGICSRTVENDICTFADCIFTYLQLDSLWWICQRTKLSQCSCHQNKLAKKEKTRTKLTRKCCHQHRLLPLQSLLASNALLSSLHRIHKNWRSWATYSIKSLLILSVSTQV